MLLVALSVLTLLLAIASVVHMLRCARPTGEALGSAPSDDELRKHILWYSFYVNPEDPRGWVPKSWGGGVTPNFRTRRAALLFAALIMLTAFSAMGLLAAALSEQTEPPAPNTPTAEAPAPATAPAAEELAKLDTRTPVPLQPMMAWHQKQNMMQHLVAIQQITDGLARENWEDVARASAQIESSPQMKQMCQHMGAGAAGFTEMALDFHRRADAIGEAARAHDGAAVLRATSNTLEACTGCHAAFRQDVVDAATWQARTGRAHNPSSMPATH